MRLQDVRGGDLIEVSQGGRRIYAKVIEIRDELVRFEPLCRGISYRHATPREIVAHWRKSGRHGPRTSDVDEPDGGPSVLPLEQLTMRLNP